MRGEKSGPSEYLGSAVADGVVRYLSVSSLEKFDPRSGGCNLKWWYRYVGKIKDGPDSAAISSGHALHAELATYLRTGIPMLSSLAMSGLHMVPEPGPDLLIEQSIGTPSHPFVTADSVPLIGFIDCAHDRGTNKGADDVTDTQDPPNTIELIDWKWKGDGGKAEYFMQPGEMIRSIQMSGYGVFASKAFPSTEHVRLSHGYFPAKRGKPRKVTKLHVVEDALRSWEYVDGLARAVKHVAQETSPERVDGNPHSCGKYGGCPHREICPVYKRNTVGSTSAMLFGETLAKDIKMGLMQNLPPTLAPQAPATNVHAQLAAEETALRAQVAVQSASPMPVTTGFDHRTPAPTPLPIAPGAITPAFGFAEAWQVITSGTRGYPGLAGAAGSALAALLGHPPGSTYAGTGDLGAIQFQDPAHVIQLGSEMRAPIAPVAPVVHVQHNTVPAMASILPPDAPESNPALAAKALEVAPVVTTDGQSLMVGINSSVTPYLSPADQVATEPAKPKRGRPPKAKAVTPAEIVTASVETVETVETVEPVAPVVIDTPACAGDASTVLAVYVDCTSNVRTSSLDSYIDGIVDALTRKFCPPGTLQDIRCVANDSPLAFGRYKGAIRTVVTENPPPPVPYSLFTYGDDIRKEVAEALRIVCDRTDALYVRGLS